MQARAAPERGPLFGGGRQDGGVEVRREADRWSARCESRSPPSRLAILHLGMRTHLVPMAGRVVGFVLGRETGRHQSEASRPRATGRPRGAVPRDVTVAPRGVATARSDVVL